MVMDIDRDRYSVWTWKHPVSLHWIINPGLAINELILGQRLPAVMLVDKTSPRPFVERSYVPCPTCGARNPGLIYSKVAMGNFGGLICAACGKQLPMLKNALTWLVMTITWPLWKPFEARIGPKLRARQFARLQEANKSLMQLGEVKSIAKPSGLRMGVNFGLMMAALYIAMSLWNGTPWTAAIGFGLLGGLVAGVLFGVIMKFVVSRKGKALKSD